MNGLWATLSRGEQLLVAGAALIFVVADVLIGLINGFGVEDAIAVCAVLVLGFVYLEHTGKSDGWLFPYPVVVMILTIIVAVFALNGLIGTLRSGFGNVSGIDILGEVAVWVGAALMLVGWWLDWGSRRKA